MRTIFLTGATGDIGRAIAHKYRACGDDVIAPTRAEMDLLDSNSIVNFISSLTPVDVVIHCAGFNVPKRIGDIAPDDIAKTLQINAVSFYDMMHSLIQQKKLREQGHVLGVSSIYGSLARKGRFSYVASKHCLHGMVKTLALELGEQGIKCNVISPGFVDTDMTRRNNTPDMIAGFARKIPLGRLASTAEIAEAVYFLCSPQNSFITGQEIIIDGGYSIGGFE